MLGTNVLVHHSYIQFAFSKVFYLMFSSHASSLRVANAAFALLVARRATQTAGNARRQCQSFGSVATIARNTHESWGTGQLPSDDVGRASKRGYEAFATKVTIPG